MPGVKQSDTPGKYSAEPVHPEGMEEKEERLKTGLK